MGGTGSGRWFQWDTKTTVEGCQSLGATWLTRNGYLVPGGWRSGTVRWSDPDTKEVRSSIGIEITTNQDETALLRFSYTLTEANGDKTPFDYRVQLVATRPHLGGRRWWFECPLIKRGVPCARRVGKLYRKGRYFGCRVCHDLAYSSSQAAHRDKRNGRMLDRILTKYGSMPRLMRNLNSIPSRELLYLFRTLD
jgi:hypothetical protein